MAVARRDEFNREDGRTPTVMSNKMDDMKFIDGYIDTSSLAREQPGYPRISEARPQERRDPAGPATRCFKSASLLTDTLHVSAL